MKLNRQSIAWVGVKPKIRNCFCDTKRDKKIELLNKQQRQTLQEQLKRVKHVVVATKGRKTAFVFLPKDENCKKKCFGKFNVQRQTGSLESEIKIR